MAVIDLTNQPNASDAASKGIIKIIEAMASSKQAETELQKQIMLDKISRQRNLQDNATKLQQESDQKSQEQQNQMQNWGKMFDPSNQTQPGTPSDVQGVANSGTASEIPSPVSPIGGAMPQGGYTPQQPAPMSMAPQFSQPAAQGASPVAPANGSSGNGQVITITGQSGKFMNIPLNGMTPEQAIANAKATGQNLGIYNSAEEAQAAIGGQQSPATQTQGQPTQTQQPAQPTISSQYTDLGFTPVGLGQLAVSRKGQPEPKDFAYIQALNKVKAGNASDGEIQLVKDFNGYKSDTNLFPGIDDVNLSPDEIGQALKIRNPSEYHYLESLKDGKVNLGGKTSKDMQKEIKKVEAIWPGTDTTVVQSRVKVRNDYTSGPTSKIIDALNTSLLHGDTAAELIKKVNNRGLLIGNKIGNILKTQTNDPDLLALKDTLQKYNRESEKAIAGSGQVYVDELKHSNDALNAAQSVDGALSVIRNRNNLFSGRTIPLAERWKRSFGEDTPAPVLGPHAQKLLIKNGFQYDPQTGEINQGNQGGTSNSNEKLYGGITISQAKSQGYTGFDTDKNQWVK